MIASTNLQQKLSQVFNKAQATVLAEAIYEAYSDLVRTGDFNELKAIVRELAQAQARTEQRIEELAVAQKELAQAQARTERALQKLSRQVGGLSDRLGGDLEDVAYIVLHDVLRREFGWQVDPLARSWQQWDGTRNEIDVFGQAHDPARPDVTIWIVGEAKFNLTLREVERFVKKVARAREHLKGEVFPVCFCYRARPEVQKAVKDAGLRLVFSYGHMMAW